MKPQLKFKLKIIPILILMFIFLSPSKFVHADVNVNDIKFKFTCYSDVENNLYLHSGLTRNEFTVNTKYNWYEYDYNGDNYVVLAAATNALLEQGFAPKQDYIHYFNFKDTIQFKFEDSNFDSNVYNGIILDSCGASMGVGQNDPQILDVYIKGTGSDCINNKINQKIVLVSDNGSFPKSKGIKEHIASGVSAAGNALFDFVSMCLCTAGDIFQRGVDYLGSEFSWGESMDIKHSRQEIEDDEKLNEFVQIADAPEFEEEEDNDKNSKDDKFKGLKQIYVRTTADNESGKEETIFDKNTLIPIIPMDWYSSSINKSHLLDVGFFDRNNDNPNKFWQFINKAISASSHIMLYASVIILFTLLIWRSILFVMATSGGNPISAFKSKKIIDGWFEAIIMVVGVFIIMTTATALYQNLIKLIINGNDSTYLYRVNVENVYSFNTNFVGYIRYMTLTANSLSSLGYSALYFLVALFDLVWFYVMFLRMVIIALLTLVAPLTAVMHLSGYKGRNGFHYTNFLQFRNWIQVYVSWMFVPIVMVIVQKILIMI